MIGIIGAMKQEIEMLEAMLESSSSETVSGIEYVKGKLHGTDVVLAVCGIGKVFAAICAQTMILRYAPDAIINTGVAGTLTDKLGIGNLCIADKVVQHDMDTSPIGDPKGLISGINVIYIPTSEELSLKLKTIADTKNTKNILGTLASGDQFVADESVKDRIRSNFGASACDMEGASIGQVCYVNNVPFAVVRAISDGANDGASLDYPTFVKLAAKTSAAIVEEFVKP